MLLPTSYKLLAIIGTFGLYNCAPVSDTKNADLQIKELKTLSALKSRSTPKDFEKLLRNFAAKNGKLKDDALQSAIHGAIKEKEVLQKQVISKQDGKLMSNVRQTVTNMRETGKAPDTHTKTEIDVPSLGIHRVLENENDGLAKKDMYAPNDASAEDIMTSPGNIASYLYSTGQFDDFRGTLRELVDSRLISAKEAENYYDVVMQLYERLVEENNYVEKRLDDLRTLDDIASYIAEDNSYPSSYLPDNDNLSQRERAQILQNVEALYPWLTEDLDDDTMEQQYYRQDSPEKFLAGKEESQQVKTEKNDQKENSKETDKTEKENVTEKSNISEKTTKSNHKTR